MASRLRRCRCARSSSSGPRARRLRASKLRSTLTRNCSPTSIFRRTTTLPRFTRLAPASRCAMLVPLFRAFVASLRLSVHLRLPRLAPCAPAASWVFTYAPNPCIRSPSFPAFAPMPSPRRMLSVCSSVQRSSCSRRSPLRWTGSSISSAPSTRSFDTLT